MRDVFLRRHDGLLGLGVLQPAGVRGAHHVPRLQRPGGGAAAQAAALRHRLLLPARQVPHRGELRAELRAHGRVLREVSTDRAFRRHRSPYLHTAVIKSTIDVTVDIIRPYTTKPISL